MHVLQGEALGAYNTLALEGRARALVQVGSDAQLLSALRWAADRQLAVVPLGEGSNVVIAGDLDALVLRMATRGINVVEDTPDSIVLRVAAGEHWHQLVQWSIQQGFYGLENLALIPGTVGAAPIQNIGAYGVELAPLVRQVHCVVRADGGTRTIAGEDCEFGYRDSIFKNSLQGQLIITAVELKLSRRPAVRADYPALSRALQQKGVVKPTPQAIFDAVVEIRSSKLPDPAVLPNAGSFFKNPIVAAPLARELAQQFPDLPQYPQPDGSIKLPAAWLIQYCKWKGHRQGGLGVHPEHALVLVNYGSNSGEALLSLATEIAQTVLSAFDIALQVEPQIYGRAA